MILKGRVWFVPLLLVILLCCGCQINQKSTEMRTEEQMLKVSFENKRAEELFDTIIHDTEREYKLIDRIGFSFFSINARYERLAFNAHCNDHITKMDTNGDLLITEQEAEAYYKSIMHLIKNKG